MIIGIEGGLGSGKTAKLTGYLKRDSDAGFKVFANYGLNFDSDFLDVLDLLENSPELKNICIGIDEITVFVDCRKSASKMNRLISYFILQSRKRNVNFYYTTQDFAMVDFRLINHTHIQIVAEKLFQSDGEEIEDIRKYTLYDYRNPKDVKKSTHLDDISQYYGLFDTDEIIKPPI